MHRYMFGWRLVGLVVLVLAGCTPTPITVPPAARVAAPQAQEAVQAAATTVPAAPVPAVVPIAVAVEPTPEPTVAPVTQPAAVAVAPTVAPTAVPQYAEPDDTACQRTSGSTTLPAPGVPGAQDFFRSFRDPLAAAPLYNPPGTKRIGLQAGHWLTDQVPAELGRLQGGSNGGGKAEWQVNLDLAQRTAALLEADGFDVDVLPSTIPPRYQAHVFVALHADGDVSGAGRGFKIARPGFSSIPSVDDKLVETLNGIYEAATGLPRDDEHITLRMRYYYAFNSRRYCHAVATGVPQAIVEMGYLTSATDRQWLIGHPDRLARGLADGIAAFLRTLP
ncbi:MAG TPA: N-acetylmuramoyl-L-alanine amidase [Chloroflexota bacterium]